MLTSKMPFPYPSLQKCYIIHEIERLVILYIKYQKIKGELGPLSFTYFIDSCILSDIFAPTRQLCDSQVFPFVPPIKHPSYSIATLFVSYIYEASPTQAFPSKQTNIPTSNSPQPLSLSLCLSSCFPWRK